MAKTKKQKENIYNNYKEYLKESLNIIFLEINKVKTSSIEEFKNSLEESKYLLIKNTIFKKALKEEGIEIENIEGSTAAIISKNDSSTLLKKIVEFAKQNPTITLKNGLISKKFYESNDLVKISELPSRNDLNAKLIGSMKYPLFGFLNVLIGSQRQFLLTLKAVENKK